MFDKNIWLQNISLQHCWNAVAALVDANFTGLNLSGLLNSYNIYFLSIIFEKNISLFLYN